MMKANLISFESGEIHEISGLEDFPIERGSQNREGMLQIDSEKVSRNHAIISNKKGNYYIRDTHSKEGTFINNKLLVSGDIFNLSNEDELSFAGNNYLFKIQEDEKCDLDIKKVKSDTDELNGRKKISLTFNAGGASLYQLKMLSNNPDRGFLNVNYLQHQDKYRVYYDTDGFLRLDEFILKETISEGTIYKVMYKLIMAIRSSEDLLFEIKDLYIASDGIYINPQNLEIRLQFMPSNNNSQDVNESLLNILQEFERNIKEPIGYDYTIIKSLLSDRNYGMAELSNMLIDHERTFRQLENSNDRYYVIKDTEKQLPTSSMKGLENRRLGTFAFANIDKRHKFYIIQAFFILTLLFIFFSGILKTIDFIGFTIIFLGIDLWLMRSFSLF